MEAHEVRSECLWCEEVIIRPALHMTDMVSAGILRQVSPQF
jgi:hypothetical protein